MADNKGKVFFNTISTDYGCFLIAVGWSSSGEYKPVLQRGSGEFEYAFKFEKISGQGVQVVSPFILSSIILNPPRSISILIDDELVQVQVSPVKGGPSGTNTSGIWIES
ncbi:hypothetical protein KKF34_03470 [Myxococcota bacterium]|nr:hypothetical protein [Myxococcota bacterium]MBU1382149.1 hypothetical protein [Myxococcota bacterium]MBU1495916.1 hypothetical protein [Myxococcota bacterium]